MDNLLLAVNSGDKPNFHVENCYISLISVALYSDVCQWRNYHLRADLKNVKVTMNSASPLLMTRWNRFSKNLKGVHLLGNFKPFCRFSFPTPQASLDPYSSAVCVEL